MSYVPGLIIETNTTLRKVRELPLIGKALVKVGDIVTDESVVLTAEIPGEIFIVRIAEKLGCDPERVRKLLHVKEKSLVTKGDCLAELPYLFGLFREKVFAPCSGTVEYFLESTAHLGIRQAPRKVDVSAYVGGQVVEVDAGKRVTIEANGSFVQGIFGIGGERRGELLPLTRTGRIESLPELSLAGKILVGGATFSREAIRQAAERGAVGIVTGSITSETLTEILGRPLGVSMTGDEDLPFSLIITEGFGELPISERTFQILSALKGKRASLNGATQVRAGAMRPEIIVTDSALTGEDAESLRLAIGTKVRCVRAPFFGELGVIAELPGDPEEVESGAIVRVARVSLSQNQTVTVPRANLELLSS